MAVRAGVMIRGQVVMAPSRVDATGSYGVLAHNWLRGVDVFVDSKRVKDVFAYDEDEGAVLVQKKEPVLLRGKVQALPRRAAY